MARLPDRTETARLVLRRWERADAPALVTAVTESLEHLRPWMPWIAHEPVPVTRREQWIDEGTQVWEEGGDVVLGMFLPDGTVVGGSGLHRRAGPRTLEIGYWVHVAHAGRGYATEAAAAVTDLAFTVAGIDHVEIHHDRANVASRRVPEKLGYTMTGEHESTTDPSPGEDRIDWCWRIDRADWLARDRAARHSPR